MADIIDLFDPTVLDELISRIIGPDADGSPAPFYEAGTFTPTIGGTSANPSMTYTAQVGEYVRIGRLVRFVLRVAASARSGGSGNLRVYGLPFNLTGVEGAWPVLLTGITFTGPPIAMGIAGAGNVRFRTLESGASMGELAVSAWPAASAAEVRVSGAYLI